MCVCVCVCSGGLLYRGPYLHALCGIKGCVGSKRVRACGHATLRALACVFMCMCVSVSAGAHIFGAGCVCVYVYSGARGDHERIS